MITADVALARKFTENPRLRSAARRLITRDDPQKFAEMYLPHHLRGPETGDEITFSQFHVDLFEHAKKWRTPLTRPAEARDCYIAPRGAGKSTLCFLLLPMWAAAHGYVKFIAAFADSASQAELHLQTFKRELETNERLQADFPDLCAPARRPRGATVSDSRGMLVSRSGFVFGARGIDAASLGMKVGSRRPDLLLLDDIEPDEANYSAYQKTKRLSSVLDAVFPLSLHARVVMVGTVTMHGSIVHDLVRTVTDKEPPEWPAAENIQTHYYKAIVTREDGSEASLWPEKWSLEYLQSIRHTRSFAKNMMNLPVAADGGYWTEADFRYDPPPAVTRRILSIDPAVTTKTTSDYTGIAVVGYDPTAQRCVVELAAAVKLTPAALRQHILAILERDERIKAVLIEVDQGGDAWKEILSPLPVQIVNVKQHEPKNVRAARALDWYQAGWVAHSQKIPAFEDQAVAFPNVANDDVVDAVVTGLMFFLKDQKRSPVRAGTSLSYV